MSLRIAIVGSPDIPRVRRLVSGLPASTSLWRADVLHAFVPRADLVMLLVRGRFLRVRSFAWTPVGGPEPLGGLANHVVRVVLPSQRLARAWRAYLPLGRMTVVEPGADDDGLLPTHYRANAEDADDPERIVAAAARGSVISSPVAHEVLPPGALVDPSGETVLPSPDSVAGIALSRLSRGWAHRAHTAAHERDAMLAVYAELASMARRRRVD